MCLSDFKELIHLNIKYTTIQKLKAKYNYNIDNMSSKNLYIKERYWLHYTVLKWNPQTIKINFKISNFQLVKFVINIFSNIFVSLIYVKVF